MFNWEASIYGKTPLLLVQLTSPACIWKA